MIRPSETGPAWCEAKSGAHTCDLKARHPSEHVCACGAYVGPWTVAVLDLGGAA